MRLRTLARTYTIQLAVLAAIPLAGCYPFISSGTYEQSVCDLDEDGDGAVKCTFDGDVRVDIDCDDSPDSDIAPLRYPDAEEIPYDGIDNDCDGADIVDADGDSYPGISREDYEALGRDAFPSGLNSEVDCNDEDASINPGADETYYDGVDSDCQGDCDYDADLDGFADRRQGQDNDCGLPATDCIDSDADINPSVSIEDEIYYDGEDQNCDGVNDFDPDGDGEAWAGLEEDNDVFLTRYGYTDTITAYTECYDTEDTALPDASDTRAPNTVNASVAEEFYDGVDGNCSDVTTVVENDFDRDGDGFMPTEYRQDFIDYVERYVTFERFYDGTNPYEAAFTAEYGADAAAWGAYFDAHDNDCNDANADVRPGALEVLGDSVDQDCDGGVDTTPFRFGGYTWDGISNPQVRATNNDFIVTALALNSVNFGAADLTPRVAAFSFGLDATPSSSPVQQSSPFTPNTSDVLSPHLGMVSYGSGYYVSHAFVRSGNTRLVGAVAEDDGGKYSAFSAAFSDRVSGSEVYDGTDLQCDADLGSCVAVACNGDTLQWSLFTDSEGTSGFGEVQSISLAGSAIDCFVSTEDNTGTTLVNAVAPGGAVLSYTTGGSVSTSQPFTGFNLSHAQSHGDWILLGDSSRGVTLYRSSGTQVDTLSSVRTDDGDVSALGSTAYIAAVSGSDLYLAYGTTTSSLTQVPVDFVDEAGNAYTPESVSIEAAGDRVIVVATGSGGGEDVLGWMIFEI